MKEIDMQVQEAQRVSDKRDTKRPTLSYIIIKMLKVKSRENLKRRKEKSRRKEGSYLQGSSHKTVS